MELKRVGERRLWCSALLLLLLAYLAVFSILNFKGFPWFVNSDMYGDTQVARYIWEQKALFPDGWVYGNQYYVAATPVLSALFYGLTGSMNLSLALATTAMTAFQLLALWWMLHPFLSRPQILAAEVALVASILAMDLHYKTEPQLLFLLASYYACYMITVLVVWGDYLHCLLRGKRLSCPAFFLGLALSFATGMQSLRQTCIMVLPLLAFEGLRVLSMLLGRVPRSWTPTLRALAFSAANAAGLAAIRLLGVPSHSIYGSVEFLSPGQLPQHLYDLFLAAAQVTGVGYLSAYGPRWFILLFSLASILAAGAALLLGLRDLGHTPRPESGVNTPLDALLALCVLSLLVTAASGLVFNIQIRSVYLFLWYLLVALAVVSLLRRFRPAGKRVVLAALCALSVLNLRYSYLPNLQMIHARPQTTLIQVADELMQHDFNILYGRWEYIGIAAACTDGRVMGGAWYNIVCLPLGYINPQDIYEPEDNDRAAYLVQEIEKEAFFARAEELGAQVELVRQFDGMALYTASKLLMLPAPDSTV